MTLTHLQKKQYSIPTAKILKTKLAAAKLETLPSNCKTYHVDSENLKTQIENREGHIFKDEPKQFS